MAYTGVAVDNPTFVSVSLSGPLYENAQGALTAHAGGGQSSALQLTADVNIVTTVASLNDSVILPNMTPGRGVVVVNAGANSMNVFPAVGETINALSANTALAVAAGKAATFYCAVAGKSYSLAGA